MKNKTEILTLLGVILGIVLGLLIPEYAKYVQFLGSIFISLLKVLILPIIVLSLFLAIAQVASLKDLKSLGTKTIVYYFTTTSIAILTSLMLANVFIFDHTTTDVVGKTASTNINMVERIFSTNIFDSLAKGEVLHIVIFVIMFSLAFITLSKAKKEPIIEASNTCYEVLLKLINWVLKLAPIGVFALVWNTVSVFDATMFSTLKTFFIATGTAAVIHSFVTLPVVAKIFGKFNAYKYFLEVKEAIMVSLATASSSGTLPVSIKVVEESGVNPKVSRFVLPLGGTLNMDGSGLYQSLLVILFASLSGMDLTIAQQLLIFIFIALSSAGTAGVPSGGIVMLTMVLNLLEIPNVEYCIGLYIMVERFWDYPITSINVWSDLVGAKTIDNLVKK